MKTSLRLRAGIVLWAFWVLVVCMVVHTAHKGEKRAIEAIASQLFSNVSRDLAGAYAETLYHHKDKIGSVLQTLIKQNDDVVYVTIVDDQKQLVCTLQGLSFGQDYYETAVRPIIHEGKTIGQLHLGLSMQAIREHSMARQANSYRLAGLAALAGLALLMIIDSRLRMIVASLIRSTQRMASGDLSQRIAIHTGDELEELGSAFNAMAENLQESDNQLQQSNQMLTAHVAERTRELSKSEIRYKNLVDSSGDAIITTDMRGSITFYNKSAEHIFGYRDTEIIGRPIYNLYAKGKEVAVAIMNQLKQTTTVRNREIEVVRKNGQKRIISMSASILYDEWTEPMGTLGVAKDITDLKELEKRVIHSERLATIGKMSAKIAHELRNPLGSLSLNAEMLEEELLASSDNMTEAKQLIGAIADEIDRLTNITEEYLEFSRVPKPTPSAVDIGEQASTLLAFMAKELKERGVVATLVVGDEPVVAMVDRRQMRQCLINLVRNAIDAIEGSGQLTLSATNGPKVVTIAVGDSGPGIPAANREHLFEPFVTTKSGGTGLGLAICKEIITGHGGEVSIEDSPLGGASIRFTVPRATKTEPPPDWDDEARMPGRQR